MKVKLFPAGYLFASLRFSNAAKFLLDSISVFAYIYIIYIIYIYILYIYIIYILYIYIFKPSLPIMLPIDKLRGNCLLQAMDYKR